MQKDDIKTILFAGAVCLICSLVLSATASSLRERQEAEVENDRKMNILKAFGVDVIGEDGNKLSKEEVNAYFKRNIQEIFIEKETGEIAENMTLSDLPKDDLKAKTALEKKYLPLYEWQENGEIVKYAMPISGYGLWSYIYGYLALEDDLATIIGVTFYKHGETPGLGGEVSTDWFQNQFKGKEIFDNGEVLEFEVVKGAVADQYPGGNDHAVDGISGATITGNGVEEFINRDVRLYEPFFSKKRNS